MLQVEATGISNVNMQILAKSKTGNAASQTKTTWNLIDKKISIDDKHYIKKIRET